MDKKRIEEAIKILDNISNSIKESSEMGQALEAALVSLEKQIPKTPSIEGDGYAPDGTFVFDEWLCPNCDSRYEIDYEDYEYCPNCGQHIKKIEFQEYEAEQEDE